MTSYEKPERTFGQLNITAEIWEGLEDSAFKICLGGGRETFRAQDFPKPL